METKPKRTVEDVKNYHTMKLKNLGVEDGALEPVVDYFMTQSKDQWTRGKEYGWKKAWHWKRQNAEQPQVA